MHVSKREFGKIPEKETVHLFSLKNQKGVEAEITNYGGILHALRTPDKNGEIKDVTIGYDRLEQYLVRNPFFGASVGRYANRIAGGRFTLDGQDYQVGGHRQTKNQPFLVHVFTADPGYGKTTNECNNLTYGTKRTYKGIACLEPNQEWRHRDRKLSSAEEPNGIHQDAEGHILADLLLCEAFY